MTRTTPSRFGHVARNGALAVPVALVLVNALAYLLLLVGARGLDHDAYGQLVALLSVLLVGSVPALALQTVTARRVAAGEGAAGTARAATLLGCGAAVVLLAVAGPLAGFLNLSSATGLYLIAAALPATTWFGLLLGIAQGSERFVLLGVVSVVQGIGRSGGGLIGLAVSPTQNAAVAGVAIGTTVALLPGVATVARQGAHAAGLGGGAGIRSVLAEITHAMHGHGAFLLLANLDLLLARHVLDSDQAAIYAAGAVVARGALWLPQSVGQIVFARMTAHDRHQRVVRIGAAVIAALGAALVLVVAVSGHLVVAVIGGGYDELASIGWVFALIGASQALVQFGVLAGLAVRRAGRIAVLWIVMAVEAVGILAVPRPTDAGGVAALVAVVVGAAAVLIIGLALRVSAAGERVVERPADGSAGFVTGG